MRMLAADDRPAVLPFGNDLLAWVHQGGRPERAGYWTRFLVRWQTFWFERALALQRQLPACSSPATDPIFIMGLWRSGTTLLHGLLGTFPNVLYPTTWQCMNPAVFRLRRPPRPGRTVPRPMDEFPVDAFSPQEDEFALLALGVPSVYRAFIDPRRLNELAQWLDPDAWTADRPAGWLAQWQEFLAGVSGAQGARGGDRLLLKSPSHLFRIRALQEAFPNASYVWLVRDPEDAFVSNRKMWIAMFQRYALWRWDVQQLELFLAQALDRAAACLAWATRSISKDRLVLVDFMQLTRSPLETVREINLRLKIGDWGGAEAKAAHIAAKTASTRTGNPQGPAPSTATLAIDNLRQAQRIAYPAYGLGERIGPLSDHFVNPVGDETVSRGQ